MKQLFEEIPWLDDELGKIKRRRYQDVRFTYILAMKDLPTEGNTRRVCVGTHRPTSARERPQSVNEDRPARTNNKKGRKSKPLGNIDGVAIMTPEMMRQWLPQHRL